jgi:hypothetical protein
VKAATEERGSLMLQPVTPIRNNASTIQRIAVTLSEAQETKRKRQN